LAVIYQDLAPVSLCQVFSLNKRRTSSHPIFSGLLDRRGMKDVRNGGDPYLQMPLYL
jgi:hypothetical protein